MVAAWGEVGTAEAAVAEEASEGAGKVVGAEVAAAPEAVASAEEENVVVAVKAGVGVRLLNA